MQNKINSINTKNNFSYLTYTGIFILYLKLLFNFPVLIVQGTDIPLYLPVLFLIFYKILYKIFILRINVVGSNKAAILFWLYILFSTISSFFLSPDIAKGVVSVNFQIFLVYLLFIDYKSITINTFGLQKLINALSIFALLNVGLVFYTFFVGKIGLMGEISQSGDGLTRAFGLMGDQVGWFLSFFAIHSLYTKKIHMYFLYFTAISLGAAVGATIIVIICTVIYLIKNKAIQFSMYLKIVFSFLVLVLILLSLPSSKFNNIGILQRINQGDFEGKDTQTSGHRYKAITHAFYKIVEKPVLGYHNYSMTMFQKYDSLLDHTQIGDLTYLTTPNNQPLGIIADYGILGLLFFISFMYSLLKIVNKKCYNIPPYLDAFKKSAFLWMVVHFIFNQSATWFLPSSYLWVLICLLVSISYKINQLYGVK